MNYVFSSVADVKSAALFTLTESAASIGKLTSLTIKESTPGASSGHGLAAGAGAANNSVYAQHDYNQYRSAQQGGRMQQPASLDVTEVLLAAVIACPALESASLEKPALSETEAAALARMTGLQRLLLSTNSTAQPLRRPLVQLILSATSNLRELRLSYLRDTSGDLAHLRLPHLAKLTLCYAYWGESGAGERVMASLSKPDRKLQELCLHECSVNDNMLRHVISISSLRKLIVQDEDAPEESCPTNRGLARIGLLTALEHLELFGEELRLDSHLLALLAKLPNLHTVAIAGLDALHPDYAAEALVGGSDVDMTDMDLTSSMGDEDEESCSGAMDEATSRPRRSSIDSCGRQQEQQASASTSCAPPPAGAKARGSQSLGSQSQGAHRQQQQALVQALPGAKAPLQELSHLRSLRLYGPMSLSLEPPPLALLLPQPRLQHLKLSACASHANLRALAQQVGLVKLTVSHSNVKHLYPGPHSAPPPTHTVASGTVTVALPRASILGFHSEVIHGLAQLRILRLKDLPGFMDCHLHDLASVLCHLPCLIELKLRCLNLISDGGVAALAAVAQLQRLKLYALGDGVTELGIAHMAAALPRLAELKVKDCWRVSQALRDSVAAYRASLQGPSPSVVVVRCGPSECSSRRSGPSSS